MLAHLEAAWGIASQDADSAPSCCPKSALVLASRGRLAISAVPAKGTRGGSFRGVQTPASTRHPSTDTTLPSITIDERGRVNADNHIVAGVLHA